MRVFFLVGFAQIVARRHGLGHAFFKVGGIANASAVAANAAKIRQAVALRRSRQFTALASISDSVYLPAPLVPARMSRMRKPVRPHRLAQMPHRWLIAQELLEAMD